MNKAEEAINRASVMLTPPLKDVTASRNARAEAVDTLRASLKPLMLADCPEIAEQVLNLALDVEARHD